MGKEREGGRKEVQRVYLHLVEEGPISPALDGSRRGGGRPATLSLESADFHLCSQSNIRLLDWQQHPSSGLTPWPVLSLSFRVPSFLAISYCPTLWGLDPPCIYSQNPARKRPRLDSYFILLLGRDLLLPSQMLGGWQTVMQGSPKGKQSLSVSLLSPDRPTPL